MKKINKILAVIFCLTILCSSLNLNVFAYENPEIGTFSMAKPSKAWDWSEGKYEFHGEAYSDDLFTNYYFTGCTKVRIVVTNLHSEVDLTVKLLKSQFGVDWSVSTKEVTAGEEQSWTVSNLDSSAKYMIKFYNPCHFEGYIEKLA